MCSLCDSAGSPMSLMPTQTLTHYFFLVASLLYDLSATAAPDKWLILFAFLTINSRGRGE